MIRKNMIPGFIRKQVALIIPLIIAGIGFSFSNVQAAINLISNPSLEQADSNGWPTDWYKDYYGLNTAIFSYPVAGYDGVKAASVTITGYSSGDAKWHFADVPVTPGATYTFNNWYTATAKTDIDARFKTASGAYIYKWLGELPAAATWQRVTATILIPANVTSLTIFHDLAAIGTLTVDHYDLHDNSAPTQTATTTSLVAVPSPSVSGQNVTFTASLSPAAATGTVNFLEGATVLGSTTVNLGQAAWTTNSLAVGAHSITAQYLGDVVFFGSTSNAVDHVVSSPALIPTSLEFTTSQNPTIYGEVVTLTANLTANGNPATAASGLITFFDGATSLGSGSLTSGSASMDIEDLSVGQHQLSASYQGDAAYALSVSSAITQTVNAPPTETTVLSLSSNQNPSALGQSVTLTAGLATGSGPAIAATGNVIFYDGPVALATVAVTNAQAAYTTSSLTLGVHQLTAHYNGDSAFAASDSPPYQQSVTPVDPPIETNLIANPSLEINGTGGRPAGWNKNIYKSNNAVFTYPVAGIDGAKASQITITNFTSGDAKWYFAEVPVVGGFEYTFSDQYYGTGTSGVTLQFHLQDGSYKYQWIKDLPPTATWKTFSTTFVPPTTVATMSVLHVLRSTGTLIVDDFKLSSTNTDPGFAQGMVSFNFDDGWKDAYDNALPILDAAGYRSTLYVISANLSNTYSGYTHKSEWLNAQARGHAIDAHTRTHAHLMTLSSTDLTAEIAGSRTDLLTNGFTPVKTFAYPYGEYNAAVMDAVQTAGFGGARSTRSGLNYSNTPKLELRGQSILTSDSVASVKAKLDQAIATRGWAILTFHHIKDTPVDDYTWTPVQLQQIVDYVQANNIRVVTNDEGVALMNP